jgi:hypothetical protein
LNQFELTASEEQAEIGFSIPVDTIKTKNGRKPVSLAMNKLYLHNPGYSVGSTEKLCN